MTDIKEVADNKQVKPTKRKIIEDSPELHQNVMKKSASVTDMMFNDWISDSRKKCIKYTIYLFTHLMKNRQIS